MAKLIRKCQDASGGPLMQYKAGDKYPDSTECAYFVNHNLNSQGYMLSGNAWTPRGIDMVFNGFDPNTRPKTYSEKDYDAYAKAAVANVNKNFNSKDSLDKSKVYAVNMFYKKSPNKQKAYSEGNSVWGTHTGYLQYEPAKNTWYVTHNIHGTIHKEPFTSIQNPEGAYGVTAVYEPRTDSMANRVKTKLGFKTGGNIIQ